MKLLKALLVTGVVMMLVGACGPAATPTPAVVEKTVVVEKEVEVTKVVEKEVEVTKVVEKEVEVTKVVEKEVEVVVTATPEPTEAPAPVPTGPKKGGTLHVAFAEWPKNLHPQIDSGTEGCYVQVNITDSLVNIDKDGNFIPGLAKEMPERPDDVTYIFHLREGVKFHNGTDFDADDVLWTFDRLLGKFEDQKSTQAPRFQAAVESVEALDQYTVKITLKKPWDDFLPMMAADKYMDIVSKEAFEELGEDYGLKGAVGTGPFKFKEWVKDDHITLVRNEDYWGEPAYLDAIVYKAIPEESTRIISFLTGEIDLLMEPPWKDVADLLKDPAVQIQEHDSGDEKVFYLNTTQPPFDDKKVRQAVFYAIDRQAIMDTVYYGYAPKGQGIFPPWHWAYDPDADFYPYSPDKAKEMLAEAGYTEANPLEFEIVTTSATEHIDMVTMIQAQLAEIGVNVTVNAMEKPAWVAKTWPKEGTANPGYQASVYRLKFGIPTTDFSWRMYHSSSSLDLFGYNQPGGHQHPEVEQMLDDAWVITDREEAIEAYREISELITDDALCLILGWLKNVNLSHDYVKGLGIFIRDDWPLQEVWLDK